MAKKADTPAIDENVDPEKYSDVNAAEWLTSLTDDGIRVRVTKQSEDGLWALTDLKPRESITDDYLIRMKPGTYRLTALKSNGTIVARRTIRIGETAGNTQPEVLAYPPNDSSDMFEKIFLMMQNQNNQTLQMFMQSQQTMTAIITAALTNKNQGGMDPVSIVTAMTTGMASMKQLSGGDGDDGLDKVDKILSIAEKLGERGNPPAKGVGDRLLDMASETLPLLLTMGARGGNNGKPPVEPKTIASGDNPNPPKKAETDTLKLEISLHWNRILLAARKDKDPERVAISLIDLEELEDRSATVILDSVFKAKTLEEWEQQVGGIELALMPWFERFWKATRDMMPEELEVSEQPHTKPETEVQS